MAQIPERSSFPVHATTLPAPHQDETLPADPSSQEPRDASKRWRAERLPVVDPRSYQLLGEVAQGGIGRILRARSVSLGRSVALKQLLGPNKSAEERFVREALVTARLQHPSIVPIYEAGRWPTGEPFYAMKLVAGRSLDEIIAETSTLDERLGLLRHVLAATEAIAYAHSKRIIHRDLKPANILVGDFGETVVIDWGLAKDLAEHDPTPRDRQSHGGDSEGALLAPKALTIAGAIMGTPVYMPPEQALGEPVDERADVYALGAILYHLFTGVSPYEGKSAIDILRRVITGPPIPLDELEKNIASELVAIVNKAMARDPEARYPSARELAEDLRRFETGQIVGAHRYSSLQLIKRFVRRHKAAIAALSFSLLSLTTVGAVAVKRTIAERNRAESQEIEATRRADELTLVHAREAAGRDPNAAITWLDGLSPSFERWPSARLIAADAHTHGLATVLRGHEELINMVVFSKDGSMLASASDDHTIKLWDLEHGTSQTLKGHDDEVWDVKFAADDRYLLSLSKDKTVRAFDLSTGEDRFLFTQKQLSSRLTVSRDGTQLATISRDGSVWRWDLRANTGSEIFSGDEEHKICAVSPNLLSFLRCQPQRPIMVVDLPSGEERALEGSEEHSSGDSFRSGFASINAFSPDGQSATWHNSKDEIVVFDVVTGKEKRRLSCPSRHNEIRSPSSEVGNVFSPDGTQLATSCKDGVIHVFRIATGEEKILKGHEGPIWRLAFSPDGTRLASASFDRDVWLWELSTGRGRALHGNDRAVTAVTFSPDGRKVASGGADGSVRIYPVDADAVQILSDHGAPAYAVAFSPDGARLVSGSEDGKLLLWDRQRGVSTALVGHTARVHHVAFTADGSRIITASSDQTVRVWSRFGEALRTFNAYAPSERSPFALSPDGRFVVYQGQGGVLRLGPLDSGEEQIFRGHAGPVYALAVAPDSRRIASGGQDGTARVWDVSTGQAEVFSGHEEKVRALTFSPDGRLLASGSMDHSLRLWDLETKQMKIADAGGGGIFQLAFTSDGTKIISAAWVDTGIRLWDATSLQQIMRFTGPGHVSDLRRFTLSPDGTRVATASLDKSIRLWDLSTGDSRALLGHGDGVLDLMFSPDGKHLVSASRDGTVRLWADDLPMDPTALRAWIHETASKGMGAAPNTPR